MKSLKRVLRLLQLHQMFHSQHLLLASHSTPSSRTVGTLALRQLSFFRGLPSMLRRHMAAIRLGAAPERTSSTSCSIVSGSSCATRTRRSPTRRSRGRRPSTARGPSRPRRPGPPRPAIRPSARRPGSTSPRRSGRSGQPARQQGPLRRVQVTPLHVHRHHPRRHVGPALQLKDLRHRHRRPRTPGPRFRPSINWSPLTTTASRRPLTRMSSTSSSNSRPDMTGNTAPAGWTRYRLPPISTSSSCASTWNGPRAERTTRARQGPTGSATTRIRGVSATRPRRVGSAFRVGRPNITDDPPGVELCRTARPAGSGPRREGCALDDPAMSCGVGSDRRSPATRQRRSGSSLAGRPRLAGSRSRTIARAASCGLQAQRGCGRCRSRRAARVCGRDDLLPRLDEHGDRLGRGHEPRAVEGPVQGGVAVEVRLRLDTGREVVLTWTSSTPAVSRMPRCRSGDCGPSVFEARAQAEMADRKRSGSFLQGG